MAFRSERPSGSAGFPPGQWLSMFKTVADLHVWFLELLPFCQTMCCPHTKNKEYTFVVLSLRDRRALFNRRPILTDTTRTDALRCPQAYRAVSHQEPVTIQFWPSAPAGLYWIRYHIKLMFSPRTCYLSVRNRAPKRWHNWNSCQRPKNKKLSIPQISKARFAKLVQV